MEKKSPRFKNSNLLFYFCSARLVTLTDRFRSGIEAATADVLLIQNSADFNCAMPLQEARRKKASAPRTGGMQAVKSSETNNATAPGSKSSSKIQASQHPWIASFRQSVTYYCIACLIPKSMHVTQLGCNIQTALRSAHLQPEDALTTRTLVPEPKRVEFVAPICKSPTPPSPTRKSQSDEGVQAEFQVSLLSVLHACTPRRTERNA